MLLGSVVIIDIVFVQVLMLLDVEVQRTRSSSSLVLVSIDSLKQHISFHIKLKIDRFDMCVFFFNAANEVGRGRMMELFLQYICWLYNIVV
ncbi:MAG: hypothetical protein ACI90V_000545 [Bacillariaceae sp.]|jgi:hypothetical protein